MKTNVLMTGGTGTGKIYQYIKPTILQGNSSKVITDPSGPSVTVMKGYCYNVNPNTRKGKQIWSDITKTFRRIHPKFSWQEARNAAERFIYSDALTYYILRKNGNFTEANRLKKLYGDEPFRFNQNGQIQSVNKFILSKWIQERND